MQFSIRPVTPNDIPFLWDMIYFAARMPEDGTASSEAARHDPHVNIYVADWGRPGDVGVIAYDPQNSRNLGAAWVRLLTIDKSHYGYYNDETPELAIAVLPEMKGQGVGSALLSHLIELLKAEVPAVILTVRNDNPAKHLYERMGFVAIGEVINRVGTKSSKMLLKLPDQPETTLADQNWRAAPELREGYYRWCCR